MILQKGVHSNVLPPTKHFLPIGHALSFEQINSQRWQHGDHRPSSGPTLPVPYIIFSKITWFNFANILCKLLLEFPTKFITDKTFLLF